jgi:hypothetical protein
MKEILNYYLLNNNLNIYFSKKNSILYLKSIYGITSIKMVSYYFYKKEEKFLSFIFMKRFFFFSFIKNFLNYYKKLHCLYTVRIKISGLGYRIRKITNNLYHFSFNYTNMYYFYIPKNLLIKKYRKRIMLISNDF